MRALNVARAALGLFLAVALAGCYPDLDWRELRSAEGGFAVMFPARPKEVSRTLQLGGAALEVHMLRAEVNGMAFGVAYADLPPGADAASVQDAARAGLIRNIGGRVVHETKLELPGLQGEEFRAEGEADGRPMLLAARVLHDTRRYYQVLFIGPSERAAEVDLDFFLGSFRPLRP
ncbi:MAG: hypothetical protein IRY96_06275 [Burkholderiales bacterium]|nr:hypothetical protein [Burkholderiales bacterium]PZN02398.1 MAG: hypothetical protein DIU74_07955 [Pseudomonadota bacterium]